MNKPTLSEVTKTLAQAANLNALVAELTAAKSFDDLVMMMVLDGFAPTLTPRPRQHAKNRRKAILAHALNQAAAKWGSQTKCWEG